MIACLKQVPVRDDRPVVFIFWGPIEPDVDAVCWGCACCGDLILKGPPEQFLGSIYFCLCGALNEIP
jgi:hypothetical protein